MKKVSLFCVIILLFISLLISCNNAAIEVKKYKVLFVSDGNTVVSSEVEQGRIVYSPQLEPK